MHHDAHLYYITFHLRCRSVSWVEVPGLGRQGVLHVIVIISCSLFFFSHPKAAAEKGVCCISLLRITSCCSKTSMYLNRPSWQSSSGRSSVICGEGLLWLQVDALLDEQTPSKKPLLPGKLSAESQASEEQGDRRGFIFAKQKK